jgi:hypothetical protein
MDVETIETTNETETVTEVSADGRTFTETTTVTNETPVVNPSDEVRDWLQRLEDRLGNIEASLTEDEGSARGRMENGATETVVESPPAEDTPKSEGKAETKADAPPTEGEAKPKAKKRHAGFFF